MKTNPKTYLAKPGEIQPKWHLVDGTGQVVGRLASEIAMILMGKHKPTYTPSVDTGDFVIVVNVEKIVLTGRKLENKEYTHYTGYTRLRVETAGQRMERKPELVLTEAVRRMLPKNRLAVQMLTKLKVYVGGEHPHVAQQPQPLKIKYRKAGTKPKKQLKTAAAAK